MKAVAAGFDGVGLVLVEDLARCSIVGIDLDHVIGEDGSIEPWASEVLEKFAHCYAERSPSGNGLRIFCRGVARRCGKGGPHNRLEVYDHNSPRYLTVTGVALPNSGEVVEAQSALDWVHEFYMAREPAAREQLPVETAQAALSDDEVLSRAFGARNQEKFGQLWRGEHAGDDSAADASLVSMLRFWTSDPAQIDRLFRRSGLMREKWDSPRGNSTYGAMTITKMLAASHESFTPPSVNARREGVVLVRGSTLKPRPIAWLWPHWLARGKLHVLAGAPGQGKTTIALAFAATVTAGGHWPDRTPCDAANVLVWSGEDDAGDTLMPRLLAMGADPARVYFVEGTRVDGEIQPFDPARDLSHLREQAEAIGSVALLIVDPIVSAVTGDSHKNSEVRRSLQPLVDLGAALEAAVVGISHFTKNTAGRDPTERVTGSVAFSAIARVVMCAAKASDDVATGNRRILVRSKSNIGPDDGGFEYTIEQISLPAHEGVSASCIKWGTQVAGTARDLLAAAEPDPRSHGSGAVGEEAATFLGDLLKHGRLSSRDASSRMKAEGYSEKLIRRARERLKLVVTREGFGRDMVSYWELPFAPSLATPAHASVTPTLGTNGQECGSARPSADSNDVAKALRGSPPPPPNEHARPRRRLICSVPLNDENPSS